MGTRGPIGKRSDQRHGHRSAAERSRTTTAPSGGRPRIPRADADWHPIARAMYNSLRWSGQSEFFEQSDWATATLAADTTSRLLKADKLSAMMLSAVDAMWARLLVTEADRRRLRVELEKPVADHDAAAAVTDLDRIRQRLTAPGRE